MGKSGKRLERSTVLAFCAGVLFTWSCTYLMSRLPPVSFIQLIERIEGQRAAIGCVRPEPAGLGLTPLALQQQTGAADAASDILIVAARHDQDVSWLDVYLSDIPHLIYQVDSPNNTRGAQHATLANKGNEAMGYLQFIIDYYDRLPASAVFLHGYRESWHLRDHVPLLRRLKWGALPFANIRYLNGPNDRLPWRCGKHFNDSVYQRYSNRKYDDCNWVGNVIRPFQLEPRASAEVQDLTQDEWYDSVEMFTVWNQVFAGELGPLPPLIKAPCCAEFMVTRDRIRSHSRDFYIHLRDWVLATEVDAYRCGRVFEYTWHMIFGEPAILDPVPECTLLSCDAADALPDVHT